MSRKRNKIVVAPAPSPAPPAEKLHLATLLGQLVILVIVAIGLVTIGSWIEVRLRPPPGWVWWNASPPMAAGTAGTAVRHRDGT